MNPLNCREKWGKRGLSCLKRHDFVIFMYISTKIGVNLLFDSYSCVQFRRAKFVCIAKKINRCCKGYVFLCSPCTLHGLIYMHAIAIALGQQIFISESSEIARAYM